MLNSPAMAAGKRRVAGKGQISVHPANDDGTEDDLMRRIAAEMAGLPRTSGAPGAAPIELKWNRWPDLHGLGETGSRRKAGQRCEEGSS
jgi:hypothetical protein